MKKLLIIVLALMLLLSACGAEPEPVPTEQTQEPTTEETTVPLPGVLFDGVSVEYEQAYTYEPYGDGLYMIVNYVVTNTGTEPCMPINCVSVAATQGDKQMQAVDFVQEDAPEHFGNDRKLLEPGESIVCYAAFAYEAMGGRVNLVFTNDTFDTELTVELAATLRLVRDN